jgi:hypothetical protein
MAESAFNGLHSVSLVGEAGISAFVAVEVKESDGDGVMAFKRNESQSGYRRRAGKARCIASRDGDDGG